MNPRGFDDLLDKMADNDHIKLGNVIEIKTNFALRPAYDLLKIGNAPNDPVMTLSTLLSKVPGTH